MDVMTCFPSLAMTYRYSQLAAIVALDVLSAAARKTVVAMASERRLLLAWFWLEWPPLYRQDSQRLGRRSSYCRDRWKAQPRLWQQAFLVASPSPCQQSVHLAEVKPIQKLGLLRGLISPSMA